MRAPLPTVALLALALSLPACRSLPQGGTTAPAAPAQTQPGPAAAPVAAADDNLNAVLWVQAAAEYAAATRTVYNAATERLDEALADPDWNALVPAEREAGAGPRKPAVILDIDETVLDNSPYQARLIRDQAEYSDPTWDAWVTEARARPVPGVVEFARAAAAQGITLLYLSNRAVHLKDATLANLRAVGMPVASDEVFLGLGTVVPGCEQNGSEKTCRRRLAAREYRVLMQFGDQLGDFAEVVANTPQGRAQLLERHRDWFGQRWWMLPNPTYGSWEPALFDNAWSLPRPQRREAKHGALEFSEK